LVATQGKLPGLTLPLAAAIRPTLVQNRTTTISHLPTSPTLTSAITALPRKALIMVPEPSNARRLGTLLLALALSIGVPATAVSVVQYLHRNPPIAIIAVSLYELVLAAAGFISQISTELRVRWSNRAADALDSWLRRKVSRFTRAYLGYVRAFTRYMDVKGLSTAGQHILEMKDILITLSLSATSLHRLSPDPVRRHSSGNLIPRETIWHWVDEAQRSGNLLSIIGPPGSGKTTLLRHVAFVLAKGRGYSRSVNTPNKIPILINLREHKSWPADHSFSLANLLRASLVALNRPEPPSWIEVNLRRGRFAVLLDGLDEIPEQHARATVTEWLNHQVSAQAGNLFILTSRPFGYRDNPVEGAVVVEVQPLAEHQISSFVNQWYMAATARSHGADNQSSRLSATTGSAELLARLDQMPSLFELTANPLLLTMLVNVHYYRGALPGSRAELYDEICDVFLAKRDRARGVRIDIPGPRKRVVLRALAYEMTSREITEVSSGVASQYIAPVLSKIQHDIEPLDFLRTIEDAAGLLVQKERGIYSFAHLTFQEYLCAEFLKESGTADQIIANLSSSWWQETIRLYAAISDATAIVNACLEQRGNTDLLVLGLQCAEEANIIAKETRLAVSECLNPPNARKDIVSRNVAARARLQLRLNKDVVLQRNSFIGKPYITWLEYQYFIDSRASDSCFVPDHWCEGLYSPSDENNPVVGIRYHDAAEFCRWLAIELGSAFEFRLPSFDEIEKALESTHPNYAPKPLAFWTLTQQAHSRDGRFWPLLRFREKGYRRDVYPFDIGLQARGDYAGKISADLDRLRTSSGTRSALIRDSRSLSSASFAGVDSQAELILELIARCWPKLSACDAGQTEGDIQLADTLVREYIGINSLASDGGAAAQSRLAGYAHELHELASVALDRRRYCDRGSSRMKNLRMTARLIALMAAVECMGLHVEHGGPVSLPAREIVTKPTRKVPNPSRLPTVAMNVLAHAFVSIYADLLIIDGRINGEVTPSESITYVREASGINRYSRRSDTVPERQMLGKYSGRWIKEIFDRTAALAALLVLAPLFAVLSILIRLSDPGPALFRQVRVGLNGRAFTQYKFRTMVLDAELLKAELFARPDKDAVLFKIRSDPRITPIGRWLRRWSLDELPQLINVLLGDMSLVGPRPALPAEVARYGDMVRRRLAVKPGLTGIWQVSGRSDLSWEESVRLELRYVEHWSFILDLQILWKTFSAVVRGAGAY
jgi:lipopolysaccharide/colanic/teichoic acid biosynthesis glycosyltransferase/energy-coupling factor transporter ATP-binding protein EcfA2